MVMVVTVPLIMHVIDNLFNMSFLRLRFRVSSMMVLKKPTMMMMMIIMMMMMMIMIMVMVVMMVMMVMMVMTLTVPSFFLVSSLKKILTHSLHISIHDNDNGDDVNDGDDGDNGSDTS